MVSLPVLLVNSPEVADSPEGLLLGVVQIILGQEGEVLAVNDFVAIEFGLRVKSGFAGSSTKTGLQRFNIGIVNTMAVIYIAVPQKIPFHR